MEKQHVINKLTELYEKIIDEHTFFDTYAKEEYIDISSAKFTALIEELIEQVRHYR